VELKVEYVNIDTIKPYKRNAKTHPKEQVEQIKKSIQEFGNCDPIGVWHGEIVEGHGRYLALKELGETTIPIIRLDSLTDEQRRAYGLVHNQLTMNSPWDIPALDLELADLDFDMSEFGFGDLEEEAPRETQEDNFEEEIPTEAKSKRGDIYQLGDHRLMCGDSTSKEDVDVLLGGAHGKILFTSPPYSDMREYEGGKSLDITHISKFISTFHDYADYQCVNLGIQFKDKEVFPYWDEYIREAHECNMKCLAWNVWDKTSVGSVASAKAFFPTRHEFIFVFGADTQENNRTWAKKEGSIITKHETRGVRQKDGSMAYSSKGDQSHRFKRMESVSTILYAIGNDRVGHPAPFPVALPSEYIQAMTNDGDIVCEPFCGGGTTLIACEQLGRKCYAMELEPKYIDLIIARWEKFTGRKAEKIAP